MRAYIYQAALLCETCGKATCDELTNAGKAPPDVLDESSYDSDDFPKGPYSNGGGESDAPQHCDTLTCREFLHNPLTPDGYRYVKARLDASAATSLAGLSPIGAWATWYGFRYWDAEDCADGLDTSRTPGWYSDEMEAA